MSKKFQGGNAKNARIRIDYSGKKPKVEFSYPSKKNGFEGSMLPLIFMGWIIIWGIFMFGFATYRDFMVSENQTNSSGNLTVNGTYYNITTYSGCVGFMQAKVNELSDETCKTITSKDYTPPTFFQTLKKELKEDFDLGILGIILSIFLPPFLIYLPFKKKWQNIYPKWMARGKKKFTIFNVKDVKYTKEYGYYCELPVFKNVVLNYEAKKEFGKYLKFIEIEEHKFKYWLGKPKKARSKRARKMRNKWRRKDMLNEWIWYARFYFKKKPTTGRLEVLYR